jgi:hypothetical protein
MDKKWANKQYIGLIAGLVFPLIISYLIYKMRYFGGRTYFDFIQTLISIQSFGKLLSISVFPNLLLFFTAIWSNRLLTARGVLIATVLYAVATIALAVLG